MPWSLVCLSGFIWPSLLFGFVLSTLAYKRGARPRPLPLSGCRPAVARGSMGHAAKAALRHSGWYLFCRLPRCAAAAPPRGFPSVQLPEVCPRGGASDCPSDSDLIYRLPHRKRSSGIHLRRLVNTLAAVCEWGLSAPLPLPPSVFHGSILLSQIF